MNCTADEAQGLARADRHDVADTSGVVSTGLDSAREITSARVERSVFDNVIVRVRFRKLHNHVRGDGGGEDRGRSHEHGFGGRHVDIVGIGSDRRVDSRDCTSFQTKRYLDVQVTWSRRWIVSGTGDAVAEGRWLLWGIRCRIDDGRSREKSLEEYRLAINAVKICFLKIRGCVWRQGRKGR